MMPKQMYFLEPLALDQVTKFRIKSLQRKNSGKLSSQGEAHDSACRSKVALTITL